MALTTLILLSSALLHPRPAQVYANVMVGTHGPYRFLVDTGSETSLIDAHLAAQLHLKPEFQVDVVTQNSTRSLPAMKLRDVRVDRRELPQFEVVLQDMGDAQHFDRPIRGVLGLNALCDVDFTISPAAGRLELTSERPAGEVVPYYRAEGRIAMKARMGKETLSLILDSGANQVALFRLPEAMAKTEAVPTNFATVEGRNRIVPTCWTADMMLSETLKVGTLPAALVRRPGTTVDGLFPARVFKRIHVDQTRQELILVR